MNELTEHTRISIRVKTIEEIKEQLRTIISPTVAYSTDSAEMKDAVIRQSQITARNIFQKLNGEG